MEVENNIYLQILNELTHVKLFPGRHTKATIPLALFFNLIRAYQFYCAIRLFMYGMQSGEVTIVADACASIASHCHVITYINLKI